MLVRQALERIDRVGQLSGLWLRRAKTPPKLGQSRRSRVPLLETSHRRFISYSKCPLLGGAGRPMGPSIGCTSPRCPNAVPFCRRAAVVATSNTSWCPLAQAVGVQTSGWLRGHRRRRASGPEPADVRVILEWRGPEKPVASAGMTGCMTRFRRLGTARF